MAPRRILVVGATGKQGSAFIRAAVGASVAMGPEDVPEPEFQLIALTRNASSPAATALRDLGSNVSLAEADLNDAEGVRAVFQNAKEKGGLWGVFLVLAYPGLGVDASGEEANGKLVVDLAFEYDVRHVVYSSSERGHEERDDGARLSHLAKVNIEKHIRSKKGLGWTILRPVFFMEIFEGLIGRITFSVLRAGVKEDTKLQLTTAQDVGHIACAIMRSPETYSGQAITVVSDCLTFEEIEDEYLRGAGYPIPSIPNLLAWSIIWMNEGARGVIETVEKINADLVKHKVRYEDRIARCREIYPELHTVRDWAAQQRRAAAQAAGWNGVSLWGIISGKH